MSYTADERESNLNCTDGDKVWKLYTLQQSVIGKLNRAGVKPTKVLDDGAHFYELDFNQVSFRSGKKRVMSEEQRREASERLKKAREKKGEA